MKKHTGKKRPAQYLFALVVFISTLGATQAHAADTTFNCGGTGTYTVTDAGLLTSGQGCTGDLVIDSSVVSIDHYAFYFNPNTVTSVTIPDSVLSVGMWAFRGTTAQVINIGAGLSSISGNAFDSGSIQEFNVSVDNSTFSSSSGVLFNKNKTSLVQYPAGKTATSYTIPSTVTVIESSSFNGGIYLQSVIIPNTVTTLGGGAFQQNNALRSVTIGSGITEITGSAFYNNFGSGITEMIFSSSANLKKIAGAAFLGALWTSLVVPEGVETIEAGAFNENGYLIDLRLPLTMVTLDDAALAGTGQLTKVCYLGTNTAVIDAIVANGKTVGCVSTPNAPTITGTNAGKSTISVAFTPGSDNGLPITNYEYSLNGATYIALDPASTDSPFVISGLTLNTPYTIRIKASNSLGVGAASAPVTATPTLSYSGGTGDIACGTSGYFTMASFEVTSNSDCVGAVTTPSGTTSISASAFRNSLVTSLFIPSGVSYIGPDAFTDTNSLETYTYCGTVSDEELTAAGLAEKSKTCPAPFLKSLTKPEINLKDGKYVCSVGTYVFGYAHDGVIDASTSGLVTPSKYIYNLLFSGVAQPALAATTANLTNSWSITKLSSGTLISCSVTVTVNSLSTSDLSTENSDGLAAAQSARSKVVKAAEATYKTAAKSIPLIYQKTLVDARAIWRKQTDAIRSNYFIVLDRIAANRGSKMISDVATATEVTNAAKAKATADYAANKLAAFLTADKASKDALDAKTAAIAQANAAYGTHIESIGHGVLIP